MDTLEIAVLVYFALSLKMALAVVALTTVYRTRRPSSKVAHPAKRAGGKREEPARKEKPEGQAVLKSPAAGDMDKRAVAAEEKPLKPVPVAKQAPPQVRKTIKTAPPAGSKSSVTGKKVNPITYFPRKPGAQIKPAEVRKQVRPQTGAPARKPEPIAASKGDSMRRAVPAGTEKEQIAATQPTSGEKPPKESLAGSASGGEMGKINPITYSPRKAAVPTEPMGIGKPIQTEEAAPVEEKTTPVESTEPVAAVKDNTVVKAAPPSASVEQPTVAQSKDAGRPPSESKAGGAVEEQRKGTDGTPTATGTKAGEQVDITKGPKQVQPKKEAPVESSGPGVTLKTYTVNISSTPVAGGRPAATRAKGGEQPRKERSADTAEAGWDKDKEDYETKTIKTDSGDAETEGGQAGKSGLGDLAALFATSASDFTEKSKLADHVSDVDINEVLQEGLSLLDLMKKSEE